MTKKSHTTGRNQTRVVTGTDDEPWGTSGFIWCNGVMPDLNLLIDPAEGWTIVSAAGINDLDIIAACSCRDGECNR